ncbi:MAG: DUF222 domain-containing protein [Microthrixaceae bacterium]
MRDLTQPPGHDRHDDRWISDLSSGELESTLRSTAAELAAGTHRFLLLVGEFDRRGAWVAWECRSTAHWLSWHCGIGLTAAREQVRVARRLPTLPGVTEALSRGSISYSKVRAITRVATPDSEADLLQIAEHSTAEQLERICAAIRRHGDIVAEEAEVRANEYDAEARAYLRYHRNDRGELVGSFRLPPEAGSVLIEALAAHDDRDVDEVHGRRMARALESMSLSSLAGSDANGGAARPQPEVIVHVDLAALGALAAADDTDPGSSTGSPVERRSPALTSHGTRLSASAVARIIGDSGIRFVADLLDGTQLDVGRHSRTITPALFRALLARDQHCRFPGCATRRHLHGHHIVWWIHGGATDLGNLVLLCRKHHHAIHDRAWSCTGTATDLHFLRPDGKEVTNRVTLPGCTGETVERAYRRRFHQIADSPGGHWQGDRIDWDCLFAALADHLPVPNWSRNSSGNTFDTLSSK